MTDYSYHVGYSFAMPNGQPLTIRSSKDISECEIAYDKEVDGITYKVFWGDNPLPWVMITQMDAMKVAMGCQWGANEMQKLRSLGVFIS
jgi:hypothetical protein